MSIVRQRGTNPGLLNRWLRYRSSKRQVDEPCAHCGAIPVLGDYRWRQLGQGLYCERCAVNHLGIAPRRVPLDQQSPISLISGGAL